MRRLGGASPPARYAGRSARPPDPARTPTRPADAAAPSPALSHQDSARRHQAPATPRQRYHRGPSAQEQATGPDRQEPNGDSVRGCEPCATSVDGTRLRPLALAVPSATAGPQANTSTTAATNQRRRMNEKLCRADARDRGTVEPQAHRARQRRRRRPRPSHSSPSTPDMSVT